MRLVFIYGPPASGKLTVARALSAQTGLPVFHNHLIVDALLPIFPFGEPTFVRLREMLWMAVFQEAASAHRSLIFTFAPEPTVSADFPERVRTLWKSHGGGIDFVRLAVSAAEQEARIGSDGRTAFGKLTSVDLLRQLRADFAMCESQMPPPVFEIDTETHHPDSAARQLISALDLV